MGQEIKEGTQDRDYLRHRYFKPIWIALMIPFAYGMLGTNSPPPDATSEHDPYTEAMKIFFVDEPDAYEQTLELLRAAAEQDHHKAQYYLYMHLIRGQFDGEELAPTAEALDWLEQAAKGGYVYAQNAMGVIYHNGFGVEQDMAKAHTWYALSAEQGNSFALLNLGNIYHLGMDVSPDERRALYYFERAWKTDDNSKGLGGVDPKQLAKYKAAHLLRYSDVSHREDQVAYAVSLFSELAKQDHPDAQYELYSALAQGIGTSQDKSAALGWLRKSAELQHVEAMNDLCSVYMNFYNHGTELKEDRRQALQWCLRAAKQGHAFAMAKVGVLIIDASSEDQQMLEHGQLWLLLASENGITMAADLMKQHFGAEILEELAPLRQEAAALYDQFYELPVNSLMVSQSP